MHRAEFEQVIRPTDIRVGQTVRISTRALSLEKTGYVTEVDEQYVRLDIFTGIHQGKDVTLELDNITEVTEICSCPLFHGYKTTVDGEMAKHGEKKNVKWESVIEKGPGFKDKRKPKMLLKAPNVCPSKAVWHFFAIFPEKEFKYCTDVALRQRYGPNFTPLSVSAFLGAWFVKCRLGLSVKTMYRKDYPHLNQTSSGQAFGKIPKHLWNHWRPCVRGYLPCDRELFFGSLIAARDREYGVCRLKSKMLENSKNAREPPTKIAIDEQLVHYTGCKSGLKKRMPKKTGEGIEYYTIATSNKDYFGYQGELRAPSSDGKIGKLIRGADPVAGGYKLNYFMESGARYEVGNTAPSKTFGIAMLLIFSCGMYLRYQDVCLVTDSAYGFLDGMVFFGL